MYQIEIPLFFNLYFVFQLRFCNRMSVVVGEAVLGFSEMARQKSSVSVHLSRINFQEGSIDCIYFWYRRSLCFSSELSEEMISVSHLCKSSSPFSLDSVYLLSF